MEETIENKRKRLIFRSWHRGTREMDLLLGSFADKHVPFFNEQQLGEYDDLLKENDPDLYNWYTRREDPPQTLNTSVLKAFLKHEINSQAFSVRPEKRSLCKDD